MKPKPNFTVVGREPEPEPKPQPLVTRLRKLLREERNLELRLIKVRAQIGPLKREYATETRTFGSSNEALLKALTHKD